MFALRSEYIKYTFSTGINPDSECIEIKANNQQGEISDWIIIRNIILD